MTNGRSDGRSTDTDLFITRFGSRAEGVAETQAGLVYIPFALPGERVTADVEGDRGSVLRILQPAQDRIEPFCPYFGSCGGCATQMLAPGSYSTWKRGLVVEALRQAGIDAPIGELVDAHGEGRRRATFHVRLRGNETIVGFMRARAHELVPVDACPILAPAMDNALPAARALAAILSPLKKPLDIVVTATDSGLDVDLRGAGPLGNGLRRRLIAAAQSLHLARLSNHSDTLVELAEPALAMGRATLAPPPGAFLQATRAGEEALAEEIQRAVRPARRVADLFAGVGSFALRLAEYAHVHAVDSEAPALSAFAKAARDVRNLRPATTERRDLFRRPLLPPELSAFDAVVFDPPRAGAQAQAEQLAQSSAPCVVAVSCAPGSFARDAATLIAGGYRLSAVTPIDQFRHSSHVELIAVFRKTALKSRTPRRRLLG